MNTHPGLKPTSSPSLSVSGRIVLVAGATLLILALVAIVHSQRDGVLYESETVFYFSPEYDNSFENPKNWTPAFPGLVLGPDSAVVLQGLAHMGPGHLKIEGSFRVALGATLFAPEAQLTLQSEGRLHNAGELLIQEFDNYGAFVNEIRATAHSERYQAYTEASTENKKQSRFTVTRFLGNKGRFLNEGLTQVRTDFTNESVFEQVGGGQLLVQGKVVSALP